MYLPASELPWALGSGVQAMGSGKRARRARAAASASRHDLYEQAVQEPEGEVEFVDRVFRKMRGRPALTLREDFSGTAAFSACWVDSREGRRAIAVDLDAETLDWGRKHRIEPLGERARDVSLVCADVLEVETAPVDVIVAFNFSYSLIHERADLLTYFRRAREGLAPEGVFILDFHAGPRTQEEIVEETELEGFTYVWEQGEMDALSGIAKRAIHFEFPDGSSIKNAFRYEFRVWTVPELRDLLHEAGYHSVDCWFEDFDEDGYALGPAKKVTHLPHEDSWVGYLVAAPA